MSNKQQPLSGAERNRNYEQKRKDAGLVQIKVWVKDPKLEPGVEKTEADKVRAYAAKQPKTKQCLKNC